MERKDIVSYITWGILLFVAGIIILFIKAISGFFLFYWLLGAILILVGLTYIKTKTFLGLILVILGTFSILGKLTGSLVTLLSIVGWIAFIGGIVFIVLGILQIKKKI